MKRTTPRGQVLVMRLAVMLVAGFVVFGAIWYGVSGEVRLRVWQDLLDRTGGPLSFRFILQPVMAMIAAVHDGLADAKTGRSPYFWTVLTDPAQRGDRLKEGLIATGRIILLGLIVDTIYQVLVLKAFYPGEAAIVAVALAFVPYLLLRGPIARVARWGNDHRQAQ